ncbi:MAG: exosortase/archaeosortase family protein [Candidatus Methanoperedens sp.]|nr:exosortase/archaeosortase family protein [Candidatus Methanoperedens sp.]
MDQLTLQVKKILSKWNENIHIFSNRKIYRLGIWLIISILLTGLLFQYNTYSFDKFSIAYIEKTGAYPYIVLAFCILMLYLKRDIIIAEAQKETGLLYTVIGFSLAGLPGLLTFNELPFLIFDLLLIWLGIFIAVYGKAAIIPSVLLGIYGFAIIFPPFVLELGNFFPLTTATTLVFLLHPFLPISNQGTTIHFIDLSGLRQTYLIDAGCSGSASIAVFLSLFFLMTLDIPLPWKKAVYLLTFGLAGTILQNILRLIVLVLAGYWYGSQALWSAHAYAGYILFPVWYAFFAYVYLKQASKS